MPAMHRLCYERTTKSSMDALCSRFQRRSRHNSRISPVQFNQRERIRHTNCKFESIWLSFCNGVTPSAPQGAAANNNCFYKLTTGTTLRYDLSDHLLCNADSVPNESPGPGNSKSWAAPLLAYPSALQILPILRKLKRFSVISTWKSKLT